jgi:uncharacterized metal-binding protein
MHPVKPRIQEVCEFAKRMGYEKLGLIFCVGLRKEAEITSKILKAQGFKVVSVVCKAGRIPKEELGLKEEEKIFIGEFESACNPILQAITLLLLFTHAKRITAASLERGFDQMGFINL